jgi:hypothetical protein
MALMLTCGSCGATLKVPEEMAGRKVRCSACKAILVVPAAGPAPEEPAPKKSPGAAKAVAEKPAAPKPKPEPEPEPGPDREAGEEGPGEEEAGGGGKRGPRREGRGTARRAGARAPAGEERRSGPAPRKSRALLFAGLAGAALVLAVVAVIAVASMGGGGSGEPSDEPGEGSSGGKKGSGSSGAAKPVDKDLEEYRQAVDRARSAPDWFAAGEKARKAGRPLDARRHFLRAASADPSMEKAWEALGYRKYAVPAEYRALLEAEEIADTLKRYDGRWLDPRKYAEMTASEGEVLREANRAWQEMEKYRTASNLDAVKKVFRTEEGYRERVWGSRVAPPYFLFDERGPKGGTLMSKADSEFLVNKKLRMLAKLYRWLTERWMTPLGFKRDENQLMVGAVFQNVSTFVAFNSAVGMPLPPGAVAYFHRMTTFIYLYDAEARDQEHQDELDGILFHEGTHQIVAAFLRGGSGMERVLYWFNEGIAEYVGSVARKYDEAGEPDWDFGAENPGRIEEFQNARFPDLVKRHRDAGVVQPYAYTLKELVSCRHPGMAMETVRRKVPGAAWPGFQVTAGSLIYAQAYFLLYWCFAGGDAERAKAMDRYLAMEFKGQGGLNAFKECFGLKTDEDLAKFEKDWLAFHDSKVPEHLKKKR